MWQFLINEKIFSPDEVYGFSDFTTRSLSNVCDYLKFFNEMKILQKQKLKSYEESPLFDILFSIT